MKVRLIRYTSHPERTIASVAKTCFLDTPFEKIYEELSESKIEELIEKLIKWGHLSVLEHASFTFAVDGISRVCSHQLVRHRIASYTQQSQRYTKFKKIDFITPKTISQDKEAKKIYDSLLKAAEDAWGELIKLGIPHEDARYILPASVTTSIVITMNARELLHFFKLRLCMRAQEEIRELAEYMLEELTKVAPGIFKFAGPECKTTGRCPQELSCK